MGRQRLQEGSLRHRFVNAILSSYDAMEHFGEYIGEYNTVMSTTYLHWDWVRLQHSYLPIPQH